MRQEFIDWVIKNNFNSFFLNFNGQNNNNGFLDPSTNLIFELYKKDQNIARQVIILLS